MIGVVVALAARAAVPEPAVTGQAEGALIGSAALSAWARGPARRPPRDGEAQSVPVYRKM